VQNPYTTFLITQARGLQTVCPFDVFTVLTLIPWCPKRERCIKEVHLLQQLNHPNILYVSRTPSLTSSSSSLSRSGPLGVSLSTQGCMVQCQDQQLVVP